MCEVPSGSRAAALVSVESRGSLLPGKLEAPGCRGARGSFKGGAAEAQNFQLPEKQSLALAQRPL